MNIDLTTIILNGEKQAGGGGGNEYDTSDATAVAGDLVIGKTAYNSNGKFTGTLNVDEITTNSYNEGYAAGTTNGEQSILNQQSDGDITADKVLNGYVGYAANNTRIVGTYVPGGSGGDGLDFSGIGYSSEDSAACNSLLNDYIAQSEVVKNEWNPSTTTTNIDTLPNDLVFCPNINTSNLKKATYMFYYKKSLLYVPLLDTSNVTDMSSMFYSCNNIKNIPQFNTSKVTNMREMFDSCSSLTTIPELDTSNVTDMSSMFTSCSSLTTIPELDTSNVTSMRYMLSYTSLTSLPQLNTGKVTDFSNFLYAVGNYTSLPLLDMSSAENISRMLYGNTAALTDIAGFKNLGLGFTSETASNHNLMLFSNNLTRQSVLNVFNNLYNMNLNTLTTGATITMQPTVKALLTDDDIAIATNKGWIVA